MSREILDEMILMNSLKPKTIMTYERVIQLYEELNGMSIDELIAEADEEEERGVRVKNSKLKKRLLKFTMHLRDLDFNESTIKLYTTKIRSVYNHAEITLPKPIKTRSKSEVLSFDDLPSLDEVREFLDYTGNSKIHVAILIMLSSGMRVSDCAALTVGDFIKATGEYHSHSNNVIQLLNEMEYKDVVPTWKFNTIKTGQSCVTFSTPETVRKIISSLRNRMLHEEITMESSLVGITKTSLSVTIGRTNQKMGKSRRSNGYFKLHAHALRKLFSSLLVVDGVSKSEVHFMTGHKESEMDEIYIKLDPSKIKETYMKHMHVLCVYDTPRYVDIVSEDKKELTELREETMVLKRKLERMEQLVAMRGK